MAETSKEEFDDELAKKTVRVVVGGIDDDKITKAIEHFRGKYNDIDDAAGILYYLKTSGKTDRADIGITDEEHKLIFDLISAYETAETDGKRDIIKRIVEEHKKVKNSQVVQAAVAGGGSRKSAVKRRKSSRRSSKHRKSSRRQLPLRRRRTNKK